MISLSTGMALRCSVSRTHEEAAKDVEWPGPDVRNLRQTLIAPFKRQIPQPLYQQQALTVQTRIDDMLKPVKRQRVSPVVDAPDVPASPASPSLRMNTT